MFDTHCHLNFSRFKKNYSEVIQRAKDAGVNQIVIPGTDVPTSERALAIATENDGIYAAVGIHPHHVYDIAIKNEELSVKNVLAQIEQLLQHPKAVAVGEIGVDRHVYADTKYEAYAVNETFIALQNILLEEQIKLALTYKKSVIFHNREAKKDLLAILSRVWDESLRNRSVLHCCEPDYDLLAFAKEHAMFIGVDGDITYYQEKQEFIKDVPLEMLVLETDSPFLLPEPLRTQKKFPNEPANVSLIAEYIADIRGIAVTELQKITEENGKKLFRISPE